MVRRNKKKDPRKSLLGTLLVLVCLGIGIGLLFTPTFQVDEIMCQGNVRMDAMTVTQGGESALGKNIFLVRLSDIEKQTEAIPLVENATVRRVFPNKINIIIEECVPAAYLANGQEYVEVDLKKKVLDVIADERVWAMTELFTPETEKEPAVAAQTDGPEETDAPPQEEAMEVVTAPEEARELQDARVHTVPIVIGLSLSKAEIGKDVQSKDEKLLETAFSLFQDLENAGLLSRATYIDLTDLNDVVLVIENRLQVELGNLENMAYRSQFLAKIINERISVTEYAVLDYRGDDVYVRPPEDGKERMKPTATPEPEETEKPEESTQEQSDETEPSVTQTATPTPSPSALPGEEMSDLG